MAVEMQTSASRYESIVNFTLSDGEFQMEKWKPCPLRCSSSTASPANPPLKLHLAEGKLLDSFNDPMDMGGAFRVASNLHLLPRAPMSTLSPSVQFFLHYHRQAIVESHYFLYFDFNNFITTTLLTMAECSDALRYAIAAFSALIYSIKIDRTAREKAFEFYAVSIQELRLLLDRIPESTNESQAAEVTALQLASFHVLHPILLR